MPIIACKQMHKSESCSNNENHMYLQMFSSHIIIVSYDCICSFLDMCSVPTHIFVTLVLKVKGKLTLLTMMHLKGF